MADTSGDPPLRVTAEEHTHPALQRLARAFIALARWRQSNEDMAGKGNQQAGDDISVTSLEAGDGGA